MGAAQSQWAQGAAVATAAALLVMGGALGKSAQLPLQTWLPDAMAGPTPVSALIHAATMVTAGVYLIARTHVLFELSPTARLVVGVIGAVTLLYAGLSALAQNDIKRVLAYSTISQIGYMFLALGVAAWSAAIFHFLAHAFFKALLFLSAGLVIKAMDEEHDIRKMGGLRRDIPVVFWLFLVGAAALSALPLVTAGFYSKDLIIDLALSSQQGSVWLWLAGVVGRPADLPLRVPAGVPGVLRGAARRGRLGHPVPARRLVADGRAGGRVDRARLDPAPRAVARLVAVHRPPGFGAAAPECSRRRVRRQRGQFGDRGRRVSGRHLSGVAASSAGGRRWSGVWPPGRASSGWRRSRSAAGVSTASTTPPSSGRSCGSPGRVRAM